MNLLNKRTVAVLAAAGAVAGTAAVTGSSASAAVGDPYVRPVGTLYSVQRIMKVGDEVPRISDDSKKFTLVGIPDGMGAMNSTRSQGNAEVFVNHELGSALTTTYPLVGEAATKGSLVSRLIVTKSGTVVSGDLAYDTVFDTTAGTSFPTPRSTDTNRGFGRFCSGWLAGDDYAYYGFDRPMYFTGEETGASGTFDTLGGIATVTFDKNYGTDLPYKGELHTLPDLGHLAHENIIALPNTGNLTVLLTTDDGSALNSQIYVYVGVKNPASTDVLVKNGLVGGQLFVLASADSTRNSEATFREGEVPWTLKPVNAIAGKTIRTMTDAELESATQAAGGFNFNRVEDIAVNSRGKEIWFNTTGTVVPGGSNDQPNLLGRTYQMSINGKALGSGGLLSVVTNTDLAVGVTTANGGTTLSFPTSFATDAPASPDNIGITKSTSGKKYAMVNEDPTAQGAQLLTARFRNSSVWRYDITRLKDGTRQVINAKSRQRVAEIVPTNARYMVTGTVPTGEWETSGIDATDYVFGADTWVFDVQAHMVGTTTAAWTTPGTDGLTPKDKYNEDGELYIMRPNLG